MVMPTEQQRVRMLVNYAWDMRDDGSEDAVVIQQLMDEGVPAELAQAVPALIDGEMPKLAHSEDERNRLVQQIEAAVEAEDFDAVRESIFEGADDKRTLHKIYSKLSELLLSDVHKKGTVAAFGLSLMPGLGDWPLIQALSNDDANLRYRAAFALGKMGEAAFNAIDALAEATSDSDDYVREAAAEALARIAQDSKPWWKFW